VSTAAHGVLRSRDVPGGLRDEAMERLLQKEEEAILAEREARLEELRPGLMEAVQNAANGVRFNDEIRQCQEAIEDAWNRVAGALDALRAVRSDDKAARLQYKRARNAAIRAGLAEEDLAQAPPEMSKMEDVFPGVGEGAWPSRWGRG